MSQIVAHVRKIKTAVGMANVIAHNLRQKVYSQTGEIIENEQTAGEWFDPKMAQFNRLEALKNPYSKRDKLITDAKEATLKGGHKWRNPQKNSAAAVEIVLSFSPDWAGDWKTNPDDKAKIDEFMKRSRAFIEEKYAGTVINLAEHFDEKTPHLHAVLVPLTKNLRVDSKRDKDEKEVLQGDIWRYSSGDFFGGRVGLRDFQTEIYEAVKDLGLERGEMNSRATHRSLSDYEKEVRQLEAKKKELIQREKEVDAKGKFIEKANKVIEKNRLKLEEDQKRFENETKEYKTSRKKSLKGWEMPEPKLLEGAKAYRDRVSETVKGVVSHADDLVTDSKMQALVDVEKVTEKMKKIETENYFLRQDNKVLLSVSDKYKVLKKDILSIKTGADFIKIKEELIKDNQRGVNEGLSL